ncbi:hypothetical protein SAMN05421505_1312 [Sinosporangium album]|uniref:Uncharacterized protein n=2 Tax=Sinosporangium album TaxID=504805 RepID=A0A1G8H7I3_9ACTN|nr:hypothetical protein SAMN05421505_1312 [Sinosporangium album]
MEQDSTVVDFAANLLSGLVRLGNPTAVEQVLRDTLPWIRFLPDEDAKIFLRELTEVARGAAALDNLAPVAVLLTQWRHTAEVHADPALHALVTGEPQGDFGPAHIPEETD